MNTPVLQNHTSFPGRFGLPLQKIKRAVLLFLLVISACLSAFAQQTIPVKGRVTNETSQPVAGASVVVKGTNIGTTTNDNGEYQINAPANGTLVVTSVGYPTKEILVNGQSTHNITMTTAAADLEQVVVVGYGTQRKKDVTGSVSSVNLEALRETPNTNIGQFLQGTVPGLNVGVSTFAGGTPPISIRGINTIGGNQNVLIILDGIQYTGSLSSINPDDIASIDVLKDASSTAVYGAQAANGVILITSRRGRNTAKPRISFSSAYTIQNPNVNLRPRNREEYLQDIREAFYPLSYQGPDYRTPNPNFNVAQYVDFTMRDANGNLLPNNFNWWDEGTNTGKIVENNLSISGGGERFNYLLSGGLVNQTGFIINDLFKRKTLRANLEAKPLNWWKLGLISSGSFVNQDGQEPLVGVLMLASPLHVPFDSTGALIPYPTRTIVPNPFMTYYVDNRDRNNYYFANVYSDIDVPFVKGLNYRLNFGNNYRNSSQYGSSVFAAGETGEAFKNNQEYYDYTLDNILTYNKNFGQHDITATLLYGAIERKFNSSGARATGFTRLNLSYNNLGLGTQQFATSDAWREALNYQMARVNYRFNSRYLLTATLRRDGFSGFAENFKSAYFPTLALGWILSEENFLSGVQAVNLLKLRAGYGISGNQTQRYSSIARVNNTVAYVFGDAGTTAFGQQVTALGNPDLKWERTKGLNLGIDFGFFKNRLNGSLDFYHNNTFDLLFPVNIPSVTGFGSIQTNLGQLQNNGFEAAVTYQLINKRDFNWSATGNFWLNRNKIITLTGRDANGDGKEDDLIASNLFIGRPLNTIYNYQTNGIYQLGEPTLPGFFTGTVRIVDQNKDDRITPEQDRIFLGHENPAYRFSLLNNFNYKGLSLMVFINSIQGGRDGYLGNNNPSYFREDNSIRNNTLVQIDYWSPANPNATFPRNISGSRAAIDPQRFFSRSFVRLQDVSLSYNFGRLMKGIGFQAFNVYISGKNLITWTKWRGWDPETGQGLINDGRPVLRAYTVGVNITY